MQHLKQWVVCIEQSYVRKILIEAHSFASLKEKLIDVIDHEVVVTFYLLNLAISESFLLSDSFGSFSARACSTIDATSSLMKRKSTLMTTLVSTSAQMLVFKAKSP